MTRRSNLRTLVVISIVLMAFLSPAAAKVIYVDANAPGPTHDGSSWAYAYNYLQDALATAIAGDEIHVADGIYRPDEDTAHPYGTGDRTTIFMLKNGVALYGGFKGYVYTSPPPPPPPMSLSNTTDATAKGGDRQTTIQEGIVASTNTSLEESDPNERDIELYETILSGDLAENDIEVDPCDLLNEPTRAENSYTVTGSSDTNESTILDGFTITGGNANNFEGGYFQGGGMWNSGGNPTVTNCKLKLNSAIIDGGGMRNWESSPTLIYCTFSGNSAMNGGGMSNELNNNPMLINCMFIKNRAKGQYSNGGGIYNGECSAPILVNCIFTENSAGYVGGGVGNELYTRATLINCTLTYNSAGTYGGAIYWDPGPGLPFICSVTRGLIITNCILWDNSDSSGSVESAQIYSGLTLSANYNCIQGLTGALGGTGNIDADPLFVDSDGADNTPGTEDDNLRLLPGSACIDSGDNSALPISVVTDFDGEPRIANGTVDMGAHEGPDQGILLSTESVIVGEGQTATFTVALYMDPCGIFDINIAHYSGDTDITIQSGEHLTFDSSNYSLPKTVTLKAKEDSDSINGQALFLLRGPGLPPSGVTATEQDNDTILYVDSRAVTGGNNGSNWTNAFTDLQDALTAASLYTSVNEIRVGQGIYTPAGPGGNRMASFELINGVTLKGGYAGFGEPDPNARDIELYETILSGDLNGDDGPDFSNNAENSIHVLIGSGIEPNSVIDGFTIIAGNANGSYPDNCGGGLFNFTASPTLTNCIFKYNTAQGGGGLYNLFNSNPTLNNCTLTTNYGIGIGGGMANYESSSPTLTNCTFIENSSGGSGGGIDNYMDCNIILTNCIFISNSAYINGGGVYNLDCNPKLTNCTFTANSAMEGGAMLNTGLSNVIISNCTFTGNSALHFGGGMWNFLDSNITLNNCVFSNNSAGSRGGGINSGANSSTTLNNCTFNINSAITSGGGIYNNSSIELNLTNCILWDNTPEEIAGSTLVSYSDVQGGWPGLGNIDVDPCFADVNNGDYHLKSQAGRWDSNSQSWVRDDVTSLCIDAGNPGCPVGDEPSPNGNRRNMGAYGGTAEASKSPTYWRSIADTTNDWIVDTNDLKVFANYWLQTGECLPGDFDRSQFVDFNDFAILGGQWRQTGPGPGITYDIGGCIPVDFTSSTLVASDPTRFTVTVEGQYILFEDMMRANCCPEELEIQMTVDDNLIKIYEIERFFTKVPCPCICDYPITATFGPFEPGTYIFAVYQNNSFIGSTTVTIEDGR